MREKRENEGWEFRRRVKKRREEKRKRKKKRGITGEKSKRK